MATQKKNIDLAPVYQAYKQMFLDINGADVNMSDKPSFDGYKVVSSSPYRPSELGYVVPKTSIEKALQKILGIDWYDVDNSLDRFHTVENDRIQSLVFEHCGQYFLSDWIYDRQSKSLIDGYFSFIRTASTEELCNVLQWVHNPDSPFTDQARKGCDVIIDKVANVPADVPEVDYAVVQESVRKMIVDELLKVPSLELDRIEHKLMEVSARDDSLNYLDKILPDLYAVYTKAKPCNEVITGEFAKDFIGSAKWSRGIDFPGGGYSKKEIPGADGLDYPEVKGIRYIDFKDCTNIHVLYKNGESRSIFDLDKHELKAFKKGLDTFLNGRKKISVKL